MPFLDYIEKLQNKSEATRRKILLFSSISITLLIFLFWLSTFSITALDESEIIDTELSGGEESIFGNAKNIFRGVAAQIREGFDVLLGGFWSG